MMRWPSIIVLLLAAPVAFAQQPVPLPFNGSDATGAQWSIYANGMLQQRGNMPVIAQSGMLLVNGEPIQAVNDGRSGRVTRDAKTGEVVFDNFNVESLAITRRILLSRDVGFVRYIDTFKNLRTDPQQVDLQWQTRINFGVSASQTLPDPARPDQPIAWIAQTPVNRVAVVVFGGNAGRRVPTPDAQADANLLQLHLPITLPPGHEIAVMTIYHTDPSLDEAVQWASHLKDTQLLTHCPPELQWRIVNFDTADSLVAGKDLLRGDRDDVIELRPAPGTAAGDQLHGTITDPNFTLATFHGPVTVACDHLLGIIAADQSAPRQLLCTDDGQIIGGRIDAPAMHLRMEGGTTIDVPIADISRVGFRRRGPSDQSDAPATMPAGDAMLELRAGDRLAVRPPSGPIDFVTRCGDLTVPTDAISSIVFQADDTPVNRLELTDGSRITGLVRPTTMPLTLAGPGAGDVSIPTASIVRLRLAPPPGELDPQKPSLRLSDGDVLVGTLDGSFKLETSFFAVTIHLSDVQSITPPNALQQSFSGAANGLQVKFWDGTSVGGTIEATTLPVHLLCGLTMNVPVDSIESYTQPLPQASPSMLKQIDADVTALAAADWHDREQAQSRLTALGPGVIAELQRLSPTQPPEAQDRIAAIVRKLSDAKNGTAAAPGR